MKTIDLLVAVCDIIQHYTKVEDGIIYIYNQKYILPTGKGSMICVGILNNNVEVNNTVDLDKQILIKDTRISIQVYSYDTSSMEMIDKVIASMNSQYAENIQDKLGIHISSVSNIQNTNEKDGNKILYRYSIIIPIINSNTLVEPDVSYFDQVGYRFIINK